MTRTVKIGGVLIGGKNPPMVQGMVKTTPDSPLTVKWIKKMASAGCRAVRIAVPDSHQAGFLSSVVKKAGIPVIADIHFDWRLAIAASAAGCAKIRINPSNIGSERKVREVAGVCSGKKIPIRVGSNSGSVKTLRPADSPKKKARKLAAAVKKEVNVLEKAHFSDIVISAKAEDVETTLEVNRILAKLGYPVHIGVTATGPERDGIIKSSLALGILLREGIGDTVRVSLLTDPVTEIKTAYSILAAAGAVKKKINFIACPTCGRCGVDLKAILERISSRFPDAGTPAPSGKSLDVAVMGCEVNGPGEAKGADLGIAFTGRRAVYFEKGKVIRTLSRREAVPFIVSRIKQSI